MSHSDHANLHVNEAHRAQSVEHRQAGIGSSVRICPYNAACFSIERRREEKAKFRHQDGLIDRQTAGL